MSFLKEREAIRACMNAHLAKGSKERILIDAVLLISKQLDVLGTPAKEPPKPPKKNQASKKDERPYRIIEEPKLKPFKKEGKFDI